jgi:asparagine synthase (glutamine-hydrolysing)
VALGPETLNQLPSILWHLDTPIADSNILSVNELYQTVRDTHKAILSPDGCNALFGTHAKYYQHKLAVNRAKPPWTALLSPLVSPFLLPVLGWEKGQLAQAFFSNTESLGIWQTYQNFAEASRKRLCPNLPLIPNKQFRVYSKSAFSDYVQLQWDDFHHWLPHQLLHRLDKLSMAHSLDIRTPYLNDKLLPWAIGLPEAMKWQGQSNQLLLKLYIKLHLPQAFSLKNIPVQRPPLEHWIHPVWDSFKEKLLGSRLFAETPYFSKPYVEKLLAQYESGRLGSIQPIWSLWTLQVWYDIAMQTTNKDDLWKVQSENRFI